jgi:hypothetical protein
MSFITQTTCSAAAGMLVALVVMTGCRGTEQAALQAMRGADEQALAAVETEMNEQPLLEPYEPRRLESPMPPPVTTIAEQPLPARAEPLPVKQGPAPLAYMVESAASIRIVDLETQETVATVAVDEASPLVIDEKRGISRFERRRLLPHRHHRAGAAEVAASVQGKWVGTQVHQFEGKRI